MAQPVRCSGAGGTGSDWAANGGAIVYQSREGSHWEIFSVNPDGSGQAALTRPATTLAVRYPAT